MRTGNWRQKACRLFEALSLALVLAAAPAAVVLHSCATVGATIDGDTSFPNPFGGPPIRIRFSGGNVSSSGGDGLCVEVKWLGENDRVLGGMIATLPFEGAAPPGTRKFAAKQVPCSIMHLTGGADSATGAAGHARLDPQFGAEKVFVFGGPLVPDTEPGSSADNAIYTLWVEVPTPSADVFATVLPMLASGFYAPVPPNVEVLSYTQFLPDTFGGQLIVADTDAFDEFRLDWNGQIGYADLASGTNVSPFQANGWNCIRVFIPLTDFNGIDVANTAATVRKTVSESRAQSAMASCTASSAP